MKNLSWTAAKDHNCEGTKIEKQAETNDFEAKNEIPSDSFHERTFMIMS